MIRECLFYSIRLLALSHSFILGWRFRIYNLYVCVFLVSAFNGQAIVVYVNLENRIGAPFLSVLLMDQSLLSYASCSQALVGVYAATKIS